MQKNSRTVSNFFLSLIVINMLVSDPSKGTSRLEDEIDGMKTTYPSPTDQKKLEEIDVKKESSKFGLVSLHHDKDNSPIGTLEDDILIYVFGFLKIEDLGSVSKVSNHWNKVSSQPQLWRKVGLQYCGDYLTLDEFKETPKQKVIHHYLSVYVNTLDDLKRITKIIRCYNLDRYIFVTRGIFLRILLDHGFSIVNDIHSDDLLKLCKLGYLVERGYQDAIEGKISNLTDRCIRYGSSGYENEKNPIAARELNELLVERGDKEAIGRKIEGFKEGRFGYERNLVAACSILIDREDRTALRELIEKLISGTRSRYPITGDSRTTYVTYGQDPIAARELNDLLVEREYQEAIDRKINGLTYGNSGYEKDPIAARELNDLLVEQGDQDAIERKFSGLTQKAYQGQPGELYGYEVNLDVAIEFACFYVDNGNIDIIARITRLVLCSVAVNNNTKKFLIEDKLIQRAHPIILGIGHYFKMLGLKYGLFGFEKNSVEAIKYIKLHNIPY